ncbi:hypothetical protein SAMN04488503_3032 [Humidesulfovibrio mexicanus]|uniref:Uncharacterized protein n=1 Tax=Humidesulfovibrio mexicanus TaxID=147047 RepID=A0A239CA33_9BACT|nr:hypothetical protein [Humidesulfovibrio mexicanus]SNS16960.1 hypothetical protein SAMN04488503_3032 [Humidesulfovibrio mexicanus]
MLIANKSTFNKGALLFVSFACVFGSLFLPIWDGHNGLNAADNMFNRLSKGSSYFIPDVQKQALTLAGKNVTVTAKIKDASLAPIAVKNLTQAGATAELKDGALTYSGDLGKILTAALADADDMFKNTQDGVLQRSGLSESEIAAIAEERNKDAAAASAEDKKKAGEILAAKAITKAWWAVLDASIKELQKQKLIEEAKIVGNVNKRGLEPGYNFFGIAGEKVLDNVLPLVGLLVFYVVYTMWYGFAIFDLFAGMGLGMSKSKSKSEA